MANFVATTAALVNSSTRASNYGVNQISIGVADNQGNSSIVETGWTKIIFSRRFDGFARTSDVTFGSVSTITDNGDNSYTVNTSGTFYPSLGNYVYLTGATGSVTGEGSYKVSFVSSGNQFTILCTSGLTLATGVFYACASGDVIYVVNKASANAVQTPTKVLGVNASYHFFDTGSASTSSTTNPGKGVTGNQKFQGRKAYYAVDVLSTDANIYRTEELSQTFTKDYGWYTSKQVVSPSGSVVTTYGTLVYDSNLNTLNWMLNHLPDTYKYQADGSYNTDLEQFLSVFAFQYDTWRTAVDLQFDKYDISKMDDTTLLLALQQFGQFNYKDIATGRKLLQYAVDLYSKKGSSDGIYRAYDVFTGWNVTAATTGVNLIPDINSATFLEGSKNQTGWTIENVSTYISTTPPTVLRRGSPFYSVSVPSPTAFTSYSNNGVLEVNTYTSYGSAGAATANIYFGPRSIITTGAVIATGSTVIPLSYGTQIAEVNDYVVPTTSVTGTAYFPYGTYIKSVTGTNITVSNGALAQISATTQFYITKAGYDSIAAMSKLIPIATSVSSTYSYSFYVNSGGFLATTITPYVEFYGTPTPTNGTGYISTTTGAGTNSGTSTWTQVKLENIVVPATTTGAAIGFKVGLNNSGANYNGYKTYYFDAFQFETGSTASSVYSEPLLITSTASAPTRYRPYSDATLTKAQYYAKDYLTSGFVPAYNVSSTTYVASITNGSDIGASTITATISASTVTNYINITASAGNSTLYAANNTITLSNIDATINGTWTIATVTSSSVFSLLATSVGTFIATATSTTLTAYGFSVTASAATWDWKSGITRTDPTCLFTLVTGTTNISVGQTISFGKNPAGGASAVNADNILDHGLIIGVVSSSQYQVAKRTGVTTNGFSNESYSTAYPLMYVNVARPSVIATTTVS